ATYDTSPIVSLARSILRFFFHRCGVPLDLHSSPTRRSSDLMIGDQFPFSAEAKPNGIDKLRIIPLAQGASQVNNPQFINAIGFRSEEHTSELQSRFDLVCRLLLEKKKHNKTPGRKMSEIELH